MAEQIDTSKRLLSLTTPLAAGALTPVAFVAEEALNAPYSVTIEAVSDLQSIDPGALLFKPACLTVQQVGQKRYFHGMVRAVSAAGQPAVGKWRYTLTLAPKLWFMSQTIDCRIFQQNSVLDIVTTICGEINQTLETRPLGTPAKLEYVTQYNETDFEFIARLIEQEGFYYFFQHSESDHTLIVTNQNQSFPASPKPLMAVIHAGDNIDVLSSWRQVDATTTGSVRLMDYDPEPNSVLDQSTTSTLAAAGSGMRDVMQWPALTLTADTVTARTKIAIEAATAEASLIEASGTNHMFMPGGRFTLLRNPFTGAGNVDYVVRSVSHDGQDETWLAGSGKQSYGNTLHAFPFSVTWRQKQSFRRPVMAGIFTGIVLGESGEEIHADSLGRIKVRMKWDHRADTVAAKAVWVRVIQPWAGTSWGFQHLPRVGTEVAVAFMDGDPDRPVVIGGFYNGTNTIPFAVTGEQTKSGFRTRSTTDGGTSNFSEFSIDDKKGSELVYLHAEKDMTREVENDDKIAVSHDQTLTVSNNRTVTVSNDESKTVSNNQSLSVGKDCTVSISNNHSLNVGNKETNTITSGRSTTIDSGGDKLAVQAGDLSISVQSGSVSIEAMQQITLKVGGNSITISQSGIEIKGIMVTAEGQAMTQVKGPMVQVNGDGMLMLKGGITMIN
jgi:type VI secretion system secreted protein VgrG